MHPNHPDHPNNRFQTRAKAKAVKLPWSMNEDWDGWGWSVFFGQIAVVFGFLIFGFTHLAFASRSGDTGRPMSFQTLSSVRAEIKGEVSWKDGVGVIRDARNGKRYTLSNADQVKALYDAGIKDLAVFGTFTSGNEDTIAVEGASAL
jgi:hypothetical protein